VTSKHEWRIFVRLCTKNQENNPVCTWTHAYIVCYVISYCFVIRKLWDSVVTVVTWLRAGWSEVQFLGGARDFLFSTAYRPVLALSQPPVIQWVPWICPSGVKKPGCKVPSSVGVTNEWSCTSSPPCLHGVYKDKLPLPFYLHLSVFYWNKILCRTVQHMLHVFFKPLKWTASLELQIRVHHHHHPSKSFPISCSTWPIEYLVK